MSVGKSGRTVPKHHVINKLVGQQAGAYYYVAPREHMTSFTVIDPTAGDGDGEDSTPQMLARHVAHVALRGFPTTRVSFERDPATWKRLQARDATALCADAIPAVPMLERQEMDLVVYVDDPNHSGASTLTAEVRDWVFAGRFATVFASIGTNAGSAGRGEKDHYYETSFERYVGLLDHARRARPYLREPVACRLRGDSHRWGYLIIGSDRFADMAVQWFTKAMAEVPITERNRRIVLRGEVVRGYGDVLSMITEMHTRRMKVAAHVDG